MSYCHAHGDHDDPGCSDCEADVLERRITALQERVAHAELGRDNACAQRDEAQARSKAARESAGRRIGELLGLIDKLCQESPETRDWARGRVRDILGHAQGAEKRVAR
jgi:hypothetical protein